MISFLEACDATGASLLEIEKPDGAGTERQIFEQPGVLIGRNPRADMVLDHKMVSRRHVYLQTGGGSFLLGRSRKPYRNDPGRDDPRHRLV